MKNPFKNKLWIGLLALLFLVCVPSTFAVDSLEKVEDPLQPDRFITSPNLPYESVATSDDITSLYYNPAGLGMHPLQIGYFYGNNPDFNLSDHTLFLNFFGMAFSTLWRTAPDKERATKYSFGTGFSATRSFSLGTSYSWIQSTSPYLDNYYQWDVGVLMRPWRFLSLGLVGRSLNRPTYKEEELRPRWDMGVALRPWFRNPEFITFSVDGTYFTSETFDAIAPKYGVEIVPVTGFTIYGNMDPDKNYAMGIKFSQEFVEFSAQGNIPSEKGNFYSGGFLYGIERFPAKMAAIQRYLVIDLNLAYPERKNDGSFLTKENMTFYETLAAIARAENDSRVKGILVIGQQFRGGWGQAEELRNALSDFRINSGKMVYAHLESASNKEYYIASAADEISMPPAGTLAITGLRAELMFISDLLDKIGVKADFVAAGDYKSAPNMFTRNSPTPFDEEQTKDILKNLDEHIKNSIIISRRMNPENLNSRFERGLFSADQAKTAGLIDEINYYSEMEDKLKGNLVNKPFWKMDLESYVRSRTYDDSWACKKRIALVVMDGEITSGPSGDTSLFQSNSTGSDTMVTLLDKIERDGSIKAVVIRINSPGGSGLASDIIWKAIMDLKKSGKYVIVSIGDVAASGGYYLAVGGDHILANQTSVMGSVGVFAGKFSLKGLYEKLGVNKYTYKMNSKASIWSETDTFSPEEKALLQEHIKDFYALFLQRVKTSRKLPMEEVEKHAGGRVYLGSSGIERKMADQTGGLMLAIEMARQKAQIREDELEIIQLPRGAVDILDLENGTQVFLPHVVKSALSLYNRTTEHKNDTVYFMMPYDLRME